VTFSLVPVIFENCTSLDARQREFARSKKAAVWAALHCEKAKKLIVVNRPNIFVDK